MKKLIAWFVVLALAIAIRLSGWPRGIDLSWGMATIRDKMGLLESCPIRITPGASSNAIAFQQLRCSSSLAKGL
jgi:hypothetical protein